jgi:ATPase subunit of ABC transporter with duplicated ATPase domains
MRLKKIELNNIDVSALGLKEVNLNKLGDTIALVGANGSGKTRFLNTIFNKISKQPFQALKSELFDIIPKSIEDLKNKSYYKSYNHYLILLEKISYINQFYVDNKTELSNELVKLNNDFQLSKSNDYPF